MLPYVATFVQIKQVGMSEFNGIFTCKGALYGHFLVHAKYGLFFIAYCKVSHPTKHCTQVFIHGT